MSIQFRVFVITYRRSHLLKRALESLIAQTNPHWIAEVLNDDPEDSKVKEVIEKLNDPRIALSVPSLHRGGTANFNYAFRRIDEPFAAILEDDNWWEPEFLRQMSDALAAYQDASVAIANEVVWREESDGSWSNTHRAIWPPENRMSLYPFRVEDKCGSAKLCNSAMVWRTNDAGAWATPTDIPIDVTEHFRERVVPHPIVLNHVPLVNYAETIVTHRKSHGSDWGGCQCLLIGSVFALLSSSAQIELADLLWERARSCSPELKTTLLSTGIGGSEARILWERGSLLEKVRFVLTFVRHPLVMSEIVFVRVRKRKLWEFLMQGAFADYVRRHSEQTGFR